jgi:hypothetical protein
MMPSSQKRLGAYVDISIVGKMRELLLDARLIGLLKPLGDKSIAA